MNREAKIKFLKDVEAGNVKIVELKAKRLRLEINTKPWEIKYFIDDKTSDSKSYSIELHKQIENGVDLDTSTVLLDGVNLEDRDQMRKENHIQREKERNQ
jgi:hypothetical protein